MGRRGPAPKPTALRVLQGKAGHRALNKAEPKLPAPKSIDPPGGLSGAGLEEWTRLVGAMVEAGQLTTGDMTAMGDYCRRLTRLREYEALEASVEGELAIAKGYSGTVIKLQAQVAQLRAKLGLDPSSRSQVKAVKPQEKDEFSKLFG